MTDTRIAESADGPADGDRLPVVEHLDQLAAMVASAPAPLYVRYSEGPAQDASEQSVDTESGLDLPGLSVSPLQPERWWTRPLTDWLARQICRYRELQQRNPDRIAWLLTERESGRGPDCEPLIAEVVPVAELSPSLVEEAAAVYARRFEAGRGPED